MTVSALGARARLEIDPENRAMTSVGTADHARMVVRAAAFGEDAVLLALVEARPDASVGDPAPSVLELTDDLEARWSGMPGVAHVAPVPLALEDAAALTLVLERSGGTSHRGTIDELRHVAREVLPRNAALTLTGQPAAEIAVAEAVAFEQRRILPWAVAVLALLLFAVYRHLGLVVAAMVPSGLAIVWTGAIYHWCGHRLDPIAALIEPVVLTVGVAGAVHFVETYLAFRGRGLSPGDACEATTRDLALPATLAIGTTVFGFLALALNPVPAVERFGVFAALGSAGACALTFVASAPLLALFAPRARRAHFDEEGAAATPRWETRYAHLLARLAPIVLVATLALGVWSSWSWTRLAVDTDPVAVLPREHPFRLDFERAALRLGSIETYDVFIPAGSPGATDEAILEIEELLLGEEMVVDLTEKLRRSPRGDVLITAILERAGTSAREALFARLDTAFAEAGLEDVHCVGTAVRVARDSGLLVRGQMRSLALTLVAVVVAGWIGFGSVRLALFGVVPNVLPCVVLYGGMAALGEPLSVASAMIGSVMLGLIVDDTIHVLYRYRRARLADADRIAAVAAALHHAGRPVVITSVALAGGFLAGLAGALNSTREFALLSAAVIGAALFADIFVAPSLLLLGSRRAASLPSAPRALESARGGAWLLLVPLALAVVALAVHEARGAREDAIAQAASGAPPFEETIAPWPDLADSGP